MALLSKLTKFYKDESVGLPHDKAEIWDIAWQLAEILKVYGIDEWKGFGLDCEEWLITKLQTSPDSALVDTAVNVLHQSLLDAKGERQNRLFLLLGKDIIAYLLHREDAWQY